MLAPAPPALGRRGPGRGERGDDEMHADGRRRAGGAAGSGGPGRGADAWRGLGRRAVRIARQRGGYPGPAHPPEPPKEDDHD